MMLFSRRSDLPLKNDATSRFLPWLVALMVFLSTVALAGVFVLNNLIQRWDRDVSGTLTVQVAPVSGPVLVAEPETDRKVATAIALLRETPGVLGARSLDKRQMLALLEPWLGDTQLLQDLPLPRLIDVTIDRSARLDLNDLGKRLGETVPGASLDDHRVWLSRLINLSRTIEWLATGVVILIGAVTSAAVVYATRTGMAVHHDVIEVLHQIGAQDDYIARQFADRAFALGMKGGLLGLGAALPTLIAIGFLTRRMEGGFLPELTLTVAGWLAVLVMPVVAAVVAMVTARMTVHRSIAQMP